MAKQKTVFICQQCENTEPKWYGQCPQCGAWNSFVESVLERSMKQTRSLAGGPNTRHKPQKLSSIKHIEKHRLRSKIKEFDNVMGGGIVPGSVTLLAGDPGVGKSTMLLHVLSRIGGLYVSGEESAEQVKLRAKRLQITGDNIHMFAETDVDTITAVISGKQDRVHQKLIVIDSIQTLVSGDLSGMAGSVGQIRHCAERLIEVAKSYSIPILIIGHVTKTGTIAGPKVLEHMVDTVLYLEGERFQSARILRTLKNRYGAVEEVGIFEMKENGLKEIYNASKLFLQDRVKNVPGSTVTVILEGTRPVLVEIQALIVPSQLAVPRRVANGFDYNRLQLLLAVLTKRLQVPIGSHDVFINVSGGFKILERGADLAVCMAVLSSFYNKSVDPRAVAFGEIGLLGEVRAVSSTELRIKEAKKLGFTTLITSKSVSQLRQLQNMVK